jgi:hypothetical protein
MLNQFTSSICWGVFFLQASLCFLFCNDPQNFEQFLGAFTNLHRVESFINVERFSFFRFKLRNQRTNFASGGISYPQWGQRMRWQFPVKGQLPQAFSPSSMANE